MGILLYSSANFPYLNPNCTNIGIEQNGGRKNGTHLGFYPHLQ
jgi:hypothetical protein